MNYIKLRQKAASKISMVGCQVAKRGELGIFRHGDSELRRVIRKAGAALYREDNLISTKRAVRCACVDQSYPIGERLEQR